MKLFRKKTLTIEDCIRLHNQNKEIIINNGKVTDIVRKEKR